jgi:MinD superfamily P-loop ATPase
MSGNAKELVVISGKGGTGKTSIVGSFAALADRPVLADCDVDAADLHLVLSPEVRQSHDFSGGKRAKIDPRRCIGCGRCASLCRFEAIVAPQSKKTAGDRAQYRVDPIACEGCGVCAWFCPADAIEFGPCVNGQWFVSSTRFGPMVHASLGVAEENSGKLVTTVRQEALRIAEDRGLDTILIDGSPGIGCPVIASMTGANLVLIVTEPTLSGLHDLGRVADAANHFGLAAMVCLNKWDLNGEMARQIRQEASRRGLDFAGRVRYDAGVTEAQVSSQSVVEHQAHGCSEDIRKLWKRVEARLHGSGAC